MFLLEYRHFSLSFIKIIKKYRATIQQRSVIKEETDPI